MAYKKPEDKNCNILDFETAADRFVGGIQSGYQTESTLNEMVKRYSNGGLLGIEKAKVKLLKAILPNLDSKVEEYKKELSDIVLKLEENVVSDANSIRNGTSNFYFDYEEVKDLENLKYEMDKFES